MVNLPVFKPNQKEKGSIDNELRTARAIRLMWNGASKSQRQSTTFLQLIASLGWWNPGDDSCRTWRNLRLAHWAGVDPAANDSHLTSALSRCLDLSLEQARWIVRTPTGITRYYGALRPRFLNQVSLHRSKVAKAFALVSVPGEDPEAKVAAVARLVLGLPRFKTPAGGWTSMMNGLAPALACLDPQRRFPIINARTTRLLRALGTHADVEGAISLSRLIGSHGIKNSFYLDVYAYSSRVKLPHAPLRKAVKAPGPLPPKKEEAVTVVLAKQKITIRHLHDQLVNRFRRSVEWRHELLQSDYDVLIRRWKGQRSLLIEAKPTGKGTVGRANVRMAIGQLFDYRFQSFREQSDTVDLALLTLRRPAADLIDLLQSLGIEALWFEGKKLAGTVALV